MNTVLELIVCDRCRNRMRYWYESTPWGIARTLSAPAVAELDGSSTGSISGGWRPMHDYLGHA